MSDMSQLRLLFIDAYDSFTNNIISLLETELHVSVTKIHIDTDVGDLHTFLKPFAAVLAGPGPGSADNPRDTGLISKLWQLNEEAVIPVLGVCLGFQSLVYSFGGRVERLPQPRHGISTQITTTGTTLFEGKPKFSSVQYHSLHAVIGASPPPGQESSSAALWQARPECPDLVPLAWDLGDESFNGILMAVRHVSKPFYGIQFHPESVCSSDEAKCVIRNWWSLCQQWHDRRRDTHPSLPVQASKENQEGLYATSNRPSVKPSPLSTPSISRSPSSASLSSLSSYSETESEVLNQYCCKHIPVGGLDIPAVVRAIGWHQDETVILDSEKRQMPKLGAYSIIGAVEADTAKLTYNVGSKTVQLKRGDPAIVEHVSLDGSVFAYLKAHLGRQRILNGASDIPFWGGFMGYITYEACLETISVATTPTHGRPDLCFAFVERSIVVDHGNQAMCIQSIKPGDNEWVDKTAKLLESMSQAGSADVGPRETSGSISKELPCEPAYRSKIVACQDEIRAGNSFELCLTNQASFCLSKQSQESPWERYLKLRAINPAPFASYIRLGAATILSTSPERFMSWTRPTRSQYGGVQQLTSTCQFRPIKGTVQKQQAMPNGEMRKVGLEEATAILRTPKETAENLMIVDLIRHDLHGAVGSGNVSVQSLMRVEEYESVYQLVSVIEGTIRLSESDSLRSAPIGGIDVLASSLPPGSMTGAPKKRSCEILQAIEGEPRSIYSGIIGYMSVGGGGDFSVVIRTMYKWSDEDESESEKWRIGAGGAITILSNEDDEWEEMLGKLRSTMRLLQG